MQSVILAGATGLVGSACLKLLVEDDRVPQITVVTRRPLPELARVAKTKVQVVDFTKLEEYAEIIQGEVVMCALGTTMKQARSQQQLRAVEFDFPLALARLAKRQGATTFIMVSAAGATSRSRFFYYRVKGDLELEVSRLNFQRLIIMRPSLLLGVRRDSRPMERIAQIIGARVQLVLPDSLKPIAASRVAKIMVHYAKGTEPGSWVVESKDMHNFNQDNAVKL